MTMQVRWFALFVIACMQLNGACQPDYSLTAEQPWTSDDQMVHLLRPRIAQVTYSGAALGSLMTSGWRLVWDGSPQRPGRMVVRLQLMTTPVFPETSVTEILQVGASRDPEAVLHCLSAGLQSGSARRLPDRVINGTRYVVWANQDSGMSQSIVATDLRSVIGGVCYAVARIRYTASAGDPDSSVTMKQADGRRLLDASLSSLQLGVGG